MSCSEFARINKLPLLATSGYAHTAIWVEAEGPWERVGILTSDFLTTYASEIEKLRASLGKQISFFAFSGAQKSSMQGERGIIFATKAQEGYKAGGFKLRSHEAFATNLLAAVAEQEGGMRHVFICTHALRDECCGKYGLLLYKQLAEDEDILKSGVRVWQTSHIGGHRFAPTMLEVPSMRCWGLLDHDAAKSIILRQGKVRDFASYYRGSFALEVAAYKVAEAEAFFTSGWTWGDEGFQIESTAESNNVTKILLSSKTQRFSYKVIKTGQLPCQNSCSDEKLGMQSTFDLVPIDRKSLLKKHLKA